MRWFEREGDRDGDTRERVVMAWLPIRCEGGLWVWLERVRVVERYVVGDNYYYTSGWVRDLAVPVDGYDAW